MPASFTVALDTTAPGGVTVSIDGGAAVSNDLDVVLTIATADGVTTGYQMKIFGDVDDAFDAANYRALEANAPWISYAATKNVRVSAADGVKQVQIRIRDDVLNQSGIASDTITVDTAAPVPNISAGPTRTKVSKVTGAESFQFTFSTPEDIQAWKVKAVPATNSLENVGTQIPTTAGSLNVSGAAKASGVATTVTVFGADLETASAGDGAKILKLFVQDVNGAWSTAA